MTRYSVVTNSSEPIYDTNNRQIDVQLQMSFWWNKVKLRFIVVDVTDADRPIVLCDRFKRLSLRIFSIWTRVWKRASSSSVAGRGLSTARWSVRPDTSSRFFIRRLVSGFSACSPGCTVRLEGWNIAPLPVLCHR